MKTHDDPLRNLFFSPINFSLFSLLDGAILDILFTVKLRVEERMCKVEIELGKEKMVVED